MNEFFVYFLLDKDNNPFYVGITNNVVNRIREHCNDRSTKNLLKNKIIRDLLNELGYLPYVVKYKFNDLQTCYKFERLFIKKFGRLDKETGCLTNLTDGGEYLPNLSVESRRKLSNSLRGRKMSELNKQLHSKRMLGNKFNLNRTPHNKGKRLAEDLKEKMLEGRRNTKLTAEHKAVLRQSALTHPNVKKHWFKKK